MDLCRPRLVCLARPGGDRPIRGHALLRAALLGQPGPGQRWAGKMRTIVVVPYNPDWPLQFRSEAAKIAAIFGPDLVSIHHIGSTSVPGLSAKPIIDVMPVMRDIAAVDLFNPAMIRLGYQPKGENGIPG